MIQTPPRSSLEPGDVPPAGAPADPQPTPRVTTTETVTRQTAQGPERVTTTTTRVGFFEEAPQIFSSMRLLCFMAMCTSIIFGLLAVLGIGPGAGVTLSMTFLAAAMAGKVVQRAIEPK